MLHFHTGRISLINLSQLKMGFKNFGRGEKEGVRKLCKCAELNSRSKEAPPPHAEFGEKKKSTGLYFKGKF